MKFTVKATGDVQKVEMKDKATPETPGTLTVTCQKPAIASPGGPSQP